MAKIIKFIPRHHGPRCPLGFRFPGVYRMTGFSFMDIEDPKADRQRPETFYSLDDDKGPIIIAEPVFTPITQLDPALDVGWVIVKHHHSLEIAMAYLEGQHDLADNDEAILNSMLYQTPEGVFTLLHRKPRPTCKNHLLVFCAHDPDFMPAGRPAGLPAGEFWHHITRADGELVPEGLYGSDESILWPHED